MYNDFRTSLFEGKRVCRLGLSATYRPGRETVHAALDAGLDYFFCLGFDTQMTRVLREQLPRERDRFVVATGAYNLIWTHQNLRRTLERRLRQMRTDYIDVFHFLGVTRRQYLTAAVREELAQLREDPRVKRVAISCHDHRFAGGLLEEGVLDAMMIRYNAANREAEEHVFPVAARAGSWVCGYTATSWGYLLKPPHDWPREDWAPDAASCYRFVLSNAAVSVCLTAPRTLDQFRANVRALELGALSADEQAAMRRFGDAVRRQLSARQGPRSLPQEH